MSRSVKGGKPIGWEYWGKRKGGFWVDRKTSNKMERMQFKEEDRKLISDSFYELGEGVYFLDHCPCWKSLFPSANKIEYYHHYVFGYDVLVVDDKFMGELDHYQELLSYAYHFCINYRDYEDLFEQYQEDLFIYKEKGFYLP